MEECSHHLLRREPCKIAINAMMGFFERSCGKAQENEAYDLGAAVLLPKGADPGASA